MGVKLGITRRQVRQQPREIILIDSCILQQAENGRCVANVTPPYRWTRQGGKRVKDGRVEASIRQVSGGDAHVQPKRIEGQPQPLNSQLRGVLHQDAKDDRMQMQVQVAVDVVERQPGVAKFLKLCMNFLAQLKTQTPLEKVTKTRSGRAVGEL